MAKQKGKWKAVVAYLTIIGFLVAFFINKEDKSEFATWHIKNMFGLSLMYFIAYIFSTQDAFYIPGAIFFFSSTFFWLLSLIMSILDKKLGIPWLSNQFQNWFKFLD